MKQTAAAGVRRRLGHPVIDADGHWHELYPVFLEFLTEVAGPNTTDAYVARLKTGGLAAWYSMDHRTRLTQRAMRPPAWAYPAKAHIRNPSMLPGLFYDSLDDWGIDVALVYPSMGLTLPSVREDPDLRRALVRAYNRMVAELFAPYSDRIIPAGICAMNTPGEAIEEAEYAVRSLGLKLLMINGTVPRTLEVDAEWQADPRKRRIYIDCLALDSPYDYDPVWEKFVELKIAPTNHAGAIGWPDRVSPSNFVANHLGHFAEGNQCFARGLFMGGVTGRFPQLNFAFLEGGVGWACNLYADLHGHWEKRSKPFVDAWCKPSLLDRAQVRRDLEKYALKDRRFADKIESILDRNLDNLEPDITLEALTERDANHDEFTHVPIGQAADIRRLFSRNFYFGCEADDPTTAWAFRGPMRDAGIKAVFGSDISHFDVEDPTEVLAEAWEQVEKGFMTEDEFQLFTFDHAVGLHAGMNPEFFKDTVIEKEVAQKLDSLFKPG